MKRALFALLAVVFLVAGCSSSGSPAPEPSGLNDQVQNSGPYMGVGAVPPTPRPSFTLTDTNGKSYNFGQRTDGRTTLLYFGYTQCPDICPATMADVGVALRKLPVDVADKVTVVFVTTDPTHDSGRVIARWLSFFEPNTHATWVGLRGTKAQLDAAQAASHVLIAEDEGKTHSTQVLLYSPDNYSHVSFIYNNNGEAQQIEHDLKYVVTGNA